MGNSCSCMRLCQYEKEMEPVRELEPYNCKRKLLINLFNELFCSNSILI
jgi:hypothetical protein